MPDTPNKLNDYPVYFNTTKLFRPEKWVETPQKIMNTNQSEAGTDLINMRRYDKLNVACEYACTSAWVKAFDEFNNMASFTLKSYSPRSNAYVERTVRMEGFSVAEEVYSGYVEGTIGLYTVSFNLIEF